MLMPCTKMSGKKLKVGWIDYANCTPLLLQMAERLSEEPVSLIHGVPAQLNRSLATGEIDICISSSIEYARHSGEYAVLPAHCIGSDGAVMSVLLLSSRPVNEIEGGTVLVTRESATSVLLLRILLERHWGVRDVVFEDAPSEWQEAVSSGLPVLLIGDFALKAAMGGYMPFCYDLGEEWKRFSGLPFVYALWQINLSSVAGKHAALSSFASLLEGARDMMEQRIDELALAASEKSWMGREHLAEYWRSITYNLDESHIKGLMHYYGNESQMGLAPPVDSICFYKA